MLHKGEHLPVTCWAFLNAIIPMRFDYDYQLTDMYCVSVNSISPSWAPSRPMPDCFMPPNGAAGSETRPRFESDHSESELL